MNNYHLYEEIGHGKFSMVYKGRKRSTIRYVAVKSIEKSRREKVMTEVGILSQIQHPNVVGFVNWYETRNHLWIIFEYCAGGDLLRLLKQDGHLPEDQLRRFGRDVSAGLLYVHAQSVIYSDLKPANVLFNEDGVLKLSDFGHAQRLADLEHAIREKLPLPRRGTPHYMAPELFCDGGMHSFSSDLWALGCVLHEMLAGRPPFHCASFQQLQQAVLRDPAPLAAGSSQELQAFLTALLRKGPLERPDWPAMRAHAFWQGRGPGSDADEQEIPVQPHLDSLRRMWQALCGSSPSSRPTSSAASAAGDRQAETPSADARRRRAPAADSDSAGDAEAPPRAETPEPSASGQMGEEQAEEPPAGMEQVAAAPQGLRQRLGAGTFARIRELVTAAETGVRPISRNPQIEEPEPIEAPSDLPFPPLRPEEVGTRSHAEMEAFLTKVYRCIAQAPPEQKLSALKYLESICAQQIAGPNGCQMQVADLVVNSSLLRLLLKMLQARRASGGGPTSAGMAPGTAAPVSGALRARLLALIGQLLRHATYLEPSVAELGLFEALLDGLADKKDLAVRRRSAAALGELLFYIAAQPAAAATASSPSGRSAAENGTVGPDGTALEGGWQVPGTVIAALAQAIVAPGGDEVAQHYAAKTVENIATQCPATAQRWFFDHDVLHALAGHVRRSSWDPFRVSCLAAVARLLRGRPEDQDEPAFDQRDLVGLGLSQLAPQGVPHALQLVAGALLRAPSLEAVAAALPANVVELLMGVLSQPRLNSGLRGRAAVLLTLLFALDDAREAKCLRAAMERSFVAHIDRLARERDKFAVQCVAAADTAMAAGALAILQGAVETLRQLSTAPDAAAATALAAGLVQVLPVFLHLASSAALCGSILSSRSLPVLGALCDLGARAPLAQAASPQRGQAGGPLLQVQPLVLMLMEALCAQEGLILEHATQVARCVLPALAAFLPSDRADVRLLALKSFSGVCIMFLNDSSIFDPAIDKPSETTLLLEKLLCSRALPALPVLLGDEPPAPSYATRLLAALLSRGSGVAANAMRELGLIQKILVALRGQQVLTLHMALLAHCLLQGRDVAPRDLTEAGVLAAAHAALTEAVDGMAEQAGQLDFVMVDAALGLADEALAQTVEVLRGGGGPAKVGLDARQWLAQEVGPLAHAMPLLAELCVPLAHGKLSPLLDRAAGCLQLLADISRRCLQEVGSDPNVKLPAAGAAALLEALAAVGRWRQGGAPQEPAARGAPARNSLQARAGMQRRLLAVLAWAVSRPGADAEVRAEVAAAVERLLRDRAMGDDPSVATDAHGVIQAAIGRGVGG